jgi:hypothetical protein
MMHSSKCRVLLEDAASSAAPSAVNALTTAAAATGVAGAAHTRVRCSTLRRM